MSLRGPWLLLCLFAAPAAAQDIAIYRCTAADGALTVQNQPCPKGMRQEKKMMQTPRAQPLPAALAAPVAVPAPAPAPAAPVEQPPPAPAPAPPLEDKPAQPPLYDCKRRDQTRYLTEDLETARYCVPLEVTGLDGNPRTGAGEACEVINDTCTPVADDQLCAAWQQQVQEAENHWRFATPEHAAERQQAYARVRERVAASRCGDGATPETDQKP